MPSSAPFARPGQVRAVAAREAGDDEPARLVLLDKTRRDQLVERSAGLVRRDGGEARRGRQSDIRPRSDAEQPEHPSGTVAQVRAGRREDREEVGRPRARGAQLLSERREREVRVGRCPGGDYPQRERELTGHAAQLADGRWLAPQPLGPDAPLQHVAHLAVAERPESQHVRSGARETGGEPAGRNQHKAAGARREQRLHLAGVTRIVQDDEDPSSGHQAPVQDRLLVRVKGEFPGCDADGFEEAPQRLAAGHRLAVVTGAAQVRPELPVREQMAELVSDVIRQRGLPGGRGSLDHDDRGVARRRGLACEVGEDLELPGPACEVARADGQLPRLDRGPARLGWVGRRQGGPRPQAGQPTGIDAASGELRHQLPEGAQWRE